MPTARDRDAPALKNLAILIDVPALSAARRQSSLKLPLITRFADASAFLALISSFSRPMRVTGWYSPPASSARRFASRSIAAARNPRWRVGASSIPLSALLRWLTRSSMPFLSSAALTQSAHSFLRSIRAAFAASLASSPPSVTTMATGFLLFLSFFPNPKLSASDMVRCWPSSKVNTFSYPSPFAHRFQSAASTQVSSPPALRQR